MIDSGVRQGFIMFMYPWLFNVYMDGVIKVKMGMGIGRRGVGLLEDGRE